MHSISVTLLRKEDAPKNLEVCELKAGIVAISNKNRHRLYQKHTEHIVIFTDYFGGIGEQGCKYNGNGHRHKLKSINEGLKMLGVVPTQLGYDEFDTVGLGNYRTNDKFKFSLLQDIPETLPSMTAWFKHLEKINK